MDIATSNLDLRCFRCGYSLAGLNDNTLCPECGFALALSQSPAGRVRSVVPSISTARLRLLGMLMLDWCSFLTMMLGIAASALWPHSSSGPSVVIAAYLLCNLLCALVSLHFAASIRALGLADPSLARARAVLAWVCSARILGILTTGTMWISAGYERPWRAVAIVVLTVPLEWMVRVWMLRAIRKLDAEREWQEARQGFEAFFLFGIIWCVLSGVLLFGPITNVSGGFVMLFWVVCGFTMTVLALHLTSQTRRFLGRVSAAAATMGALTQGGGR